MAETELAVRPGWTRPDGLPQGECRVTRVDDVAHGVRLRIDHADPRILISSELLAEAFMRPEAGVSVSAPQPGRNGTPFWQGAVLRVEAVNRTVVYRMVEYLPSVRGYIGEWPD